MQYHGVKAEGNSTPISGRVRVRCGWRRLPPLFELLAYVIAQYYGVVVLSVVRAVQQNDVTRSRRSHDRCPPVRMFV
jgi:hypothetical protein